jgi:hypothetical protein
MTSSTRFDVCYSQNLDNALLDRYVDITTEESGHSLTSYSLNSLDDTTIFNQNQLTLLKAYHAEFSDLDLLIYQSETVIEGILSRLVQNNIKFCYDQGGFENVNFNRSSAKIYFEHYQKYKSEINLWNFIKKNQFRPYYHITDVLVHSKVANYYAQRLVKALHI